MTTSTVEKIIANYSADTPGVKANLRRILNSGALGGTGKLIILPVDQGFEHGPIKTFAPNEPAYDPRYHVQLALDCGFNAYAAPLGMLEMIAAEFAGYIPLILKLNNSNLLEPKSTGCNQAITAQIEDALRLGCCAVGFTIYPGSSNAKDMIEACSVIISEARSLGLPSVVWSYPRGPEMTKDDESSVDTITYAAHIAASIGAHIIKVKPPKDHFYSEQVEEILQSSNGVTSELEHRIAHVMKAAFAGKRIVVFSGGEAKDEVALYNEVRCIVKGGGYGSIIGRNTFQRPKDEAKKMIQEIVKIYSQTKV